MWHPRSVRVTPDPPTDGGSFVDGYAAREVLHTTEGGPDYRPSRSSYFGHAFWPHATAARVDGIARIVQHLPISRAARAMENDAGGVETNRAHAVQLEIGWWADRIGDLPDDIAAVAGDWVTWVAGQIGCRLAGPRFYGRDAGWQLTLESAPQRFTADAWRAFDGVCGHQHVPENVHWDPGALDLAQLAGSSPAPSEEEEMLVYPTWGRRQANGRRPFFAIVDVSDHACTVIATGGAPFAGGLDKLPAPKMTYGSFALLSTLRVEGLGGRPIGIGEAEGGIIAVGCADGGTVDVARKPT